MKKKDSLIHLDHVAFSYRDASLILSDVSLEIGEGDIFLILGPSGVGKTTLLSIIGGIIKPTNGNTYYDPCLFPREKGFGYGLIDGPFFETLSVKENIFLLENFANSKIDRKYYRELLEYFELETYEMTSLISLSAGQRERVNLIRSMVHKPRVIILDEPGVNLDDRLFEKLILMIKNISMKNHTACIIASHDQRFMTLATNQIQLTSLL